ncbi:alpha/beta fold hydrolase [Rhodococcus opacus]|uniref:alpha/beta fold hydrolase n=1 Tax=Rhodococcus opacus TaxID=37919 RepID=UPI001C489D78|nr:alpha/beta hydrolase [Rhodococcus opacus]MBV6760724.1 alpha/beta hydrolase [Rhodococcus opacus]
MTASSACADPDRTWFDRVTAVPPGKGEIVVDGARIAYRVWGEDGDRAVVLVHGSAAHSRWWDHLAPWLATNRRVFALDLSGHGDSDHRDSYSRARWVAEVMAVAQASGPRPIVIGHSLGGFVVLDAAACHGAELGGVVVVDSPVKDSHAQTLPLRERARRPHRIHASADELADRFTALPQSRPIAPHLERYVGRESVRRRENGYSWHFDPKIFECTPMLIDEVLPTSCPVAVVRAEHGSLDAAMCRRLVERLGPRAVAFDIPDCGHSLMLERPLALVSALSALVTWWSTN